MNLKEKVKAEVSRRGLTAILNNTKWEELRTSIRTKLPFPPPYQVKDVINEIPYPESFEVDVWYHGDYIDGLKPFYSIEWIRIRPQYMKTQGQLLAPRLVSVREKLNQILKEIGIPYKDDGDSFWIFGYTSDTDQIQKNGKTDWPSA